MNEDILNHLNNIGILSLQDLLELPKAKFQQMLQRYPASELYQVNFPVVNVIYHHGRHGFLIIYRSLFKFLYKLLTVEQLLNLSFYLASA